MKTCEGDFIETSAGLIFDVKGLIHPPHRIIAFIRYFPDEKGERRKEETVYDKVYSLSKRYALLRKRFPRYLIHDKVFDEMLCEVPVREVKRLYRPIEKLQQMRGSSELDALEFKALQLAELLKMKANVPLETVGISGSIMAGLQTTNSDIDLIIYGSKNCRKAHSALETMFKSALQVIGPYGPEGLKSLFDFRSNDSSADFESFVRTESRKVMQGKFLGTDYFIRFVKDWNEVDEAYGDVLYRNDGIAKVKATIADDSEAIFTPCVYKVRSVQVLDGPHVEDIEEIVSFRGRFCEQARVGESVTAQGKLEHVNDRRHGRGYFRLLLGNKPSDFMVLT